MIKPLLAAMLAAQIVLGIAPAKVQAEDISAANALITDSASQIAENVADEQVNTGPHVFAAVTASGKWGTCPWSLSSDGVLTIGAGTGQNTFGTSNVPWYGQKDSIKSINLTGEVKLPQSARCLFADCTKLVEITGSGYFDYWSTPLKYTDYMFSNCTSLTHVDVGVSSKAESVKGMYKNCTSLSDVNCYAYSSGTITDFSEMFYGCTSLKTIKNVDYINTSGATTLKSMFAGCSQLLSLKLSGFDTTKVEDMDDLLSGDTHLVEITFGSKFTVPSATKVWTSHNTMLIYASHSQRGADSTLETNGGVQNYIPAGVYLDSLVLERVPSTGRTSYFTFNGSQYTCSQSSYSVDFGGSTAYGGKTVTRAWNTGGSGYNMVQVGAHYRTLSTHAVTGIFPTPTVTKSGAGPSIGKWGLSTEIAKAQYSADELMALGKTAGALTGTWYAQRKPVFAGWNTASNGSGTTYKPGDALPNQNLDLYAQWG